MCLELGCSLFEPPVYSLNILFFLGRGGGNRSCKFATCLEKEFLFLFEQLTKPQPDRVEMEKEVESITFHGTVISIDVSVQEIR